MYVRIYEPRKLGFSAEIVRFLEIHFKTNVFSYQFSTSNSPEKWSVVH